MAVPKHKNIYTPDEERRVYDCLVAATDNGEEGLSVNEIAQRLGMFPVRVGASTRWSLRIAKIVRHKSSDLYIPMERCEWVKNIEHREIYQRAVASGRRTELVTFLRDLCKMYANVLPKGLTDDEVLASVHEPELWNKAYGMLGPWASKREIQERLKYLTSPIDPESDDEPELDVPEIPDSEKDPPALDDKTAIPAKRQRRHVGKTADYYDEVLWVADNMSNDNARQCHAPTNYAWDMLAWVRESAKNAQEFHTTIVKPVKLKIEEKRETNRMMDDDKRSQFRLIDMVKEERARMLAENAPVESVA